MWDNELYAIQLMSWRLEIVEKLEGAVRHLEEIERLEAQVERLIEIERDPVAAFERFEEIIPTVETPYIDPFKRLESIRSRGFKAIKRLVTDEWFSKLETDKRLEAINWRAERGAGWANRSYERFLLLGGFTGDCTPLVMLRILTVAVYDECDQLMHPKDYDNYRQKPPEELADYLWDTLEDQVHVCGDLMDMDERWETWTTGELLPFWEGIYYCS